MATSGSVSGILDRVSCGVCMEQSDNNIHVPKLLPCQHTFCNSCLCELINNSFALDTIDCPVCRSRHTIPSTGFTTNRIALDIVDELHASSARSKVLKCSTHANMECVLVCIDCLDDLCVKCIKENAHQSHQIEELSEAQPALMAMFKEKTKIQRSSLERQQLQMQESPQSVKELSKAESDIQVVITKLMAEMTNWKKEELSNIRSLTEEASVNENKVKEKIKVLNQDNLDSGTLLKLLKAFQEGEDGRLNKSTLANDYDYTKKCQALSNRVQSILQDKNSICSQFLKQENVMESAESKRSNARLQSVNQNSMYHVILAYCFVLVLLFLLFLIDYIAPSEDHSFMHHINLYVLYACKVVAVVATSVAVIVLVDLGYVYNAILHAMYAIKDVLPKVLHFVVTCVIYGCNIAHVLQRRIILYVKHACKFTIGLLHKVITYVTDSCKVVIANPVQFAAFAFSVVVVALLLLHLIDSITQPPEGFAHLTINYVKYACKVFIINIVLCVVLFVILDKIHNRILKLDRGFFRDWPVFTLFFSFLYLFAHCISFVLTALFQFLFSGYYNPDNLKRGIVFYVVYSLEIMIGHTILWLIATLLDGKKPKFDRVVLEYYTVVYSCHIATHIAVSFDYTL